MASELSCAGSWCRLNTRFNQPRGDSGQGLPGLLPAAAAAPSPPPAAAAVAAAPAAAPTSEAMAGVGAAGPRLRPSQAINVRRVCLL